MPEMISDGTGRSFLLKVDNENRAQVNATTTNSISYVSQKYGNAYTLSAFSEPMTLPDVNIWYTMAHFKNTDPEMVFILRNLIYSWNGGNTTGDKVLWVRTAAGYTGPSANYNVILPSNMNRTSGNIAVSEYYAWDGVGNGITITGGGFAAASAAGKGRTTIELYDATILGFGDYSGVQIMSEEVGQFTMGGQGYYTENVI